METMEQGTFQTDRRKHLRVPLIVFKTGADKERFLFGYAQTISIGGLFIASINPKPLGDRFPIEFTLPGSTIIVRCECQVVWRREYDGSRKMEPGFAVQFLDLTEQHRESIESWIRDHWE